MRKGIALVLVTSLLILCLVIFSFYFFILRSHIDRVQGVMDKTTAYYLCEAGVTAALHFYYNEGIKEGDITFTQPIRSFSIPAGRDQGYPFTMKPKTYTIHYVVREEPDAEGEVMFDVSIDSPLGFRGRTYTLNVSSQWTFPVFIRGFSGK